MKNKEIYYHEKVVGVKYPKKLSLVLSIILTIGFLSHGVAKKSLTAFVIGIILIVISLYWVKKMYKTKPAAIQTLRSSSYH
jgi:glucose uptake protein GlcU